MFGKKKREMKDIHAKNEVKKYKTQMDDFQEKIGIPFHLSLPFYVISVFLVLLGLFIIIHWGVGKYLAYSTGEGFLTVYRKEFGLMDNMNDVRWKYYIPKSVFDKSLMNGIYMFLAGFVFIVLNKAGMRVYSKKKVRQAMSEKR